MRPVPTILRLLTAASALLVGGDAHASTRFNLAIPPALCQPDGKSGGKLRLVDGAWVLIVDKGQAVLWCPVVHPFRDALSDEPQVIDAFRLAYRDPDGVLPGSSVTAQLFRRPVPGDALVPVSDVLSSNSSSAIGNARLTLDVADHTMLAEPYFFKIVVYRKQLGPLPAFNGLDIHDDGL